MKITDTKTEDLLAAVTITTSDKVRLLSWAHSHELHDKALTALIVATEIAKADDTAWQVRRELTTAKMRAQRLLESGKVDQSTITHIQGLMEAIALPAKLACSGRFEPENSEQVEVDDMQG